ncbi:MAG: hypothetical protein R2822_21875 [Spirosomataceae bacterium]
MIYYFYHKIEFKSNDFLYKMWFLGWLGRLPLGFLYGLSNIFYFFIYYLVCYRKKLVFKHLRDSFPEKQTKKDSKSPKIFIAYWPMYL